jgi:hypothetical protein
MNYLNIERAQKKYIKNFEDLRQLEKQVNLSLLTLNRVSLLLKKEKSTWQSLKQEGENMRKEIEKELCILERTHFSQEGDGLKEEKSRLIDQYRNLIRVIKEKELLLFQKEKKEKFREFQQKLIRGYQAMARNEKLKKELAVWDETLGDSYK